MVRSQHVRNFNRLRNASITDSLVYPDRLVIDNDSSVIGNGFDGFETQSEWTYSTKHNRTSMDNDSNTNHQIKSPGIQRLQAIVESKKMDLKSAKLSRYPSLGIGLDYISVGKNLVNLGFRIMVKMLFLQKYHLVFP